MGCDCECHPWLGCVLRSADTKSQQPCVSPSDPISLAYSHMPSHMTLGADWPKGSAFRRKWEEQMLKKEAPGHRIACTHAKVCFRDRMWTCRMICFAPVLTSSSQRCTNTRPACCFCINPHSSSLSRFRPSGEVNVKTYAPDVFSESVWVCGSDPGLSLHDKDKLSLSRSPSWFWSYLVLFCLHWGGRLFPFEPLIHTHTHIQTPFFSKLHDWQFDTFLTIATVKMDN